MPARATSQNYPQYTIYNVPPTPKTSSSSNALYPIPLTVTWARAVLQNQCPDAFCNVFLILETFSSSNIHCSICLVITLVNAQFSTSLGFSQAPKTCFTNAKPISNLNDRPLSKEPLKTVFFVIRGKKHTIYRRKVPHLYEIVINFTSSHAVSIFINNSLRVFVLPVIRIIRRILPLKLSIRIVIKNLIMKPILNISR